MSNPSPFYLKQEIFGAMQKLQEAELLLANLYVRINKWHGDFILPEQDSDEKERRVE